MIPIKTLKQYFKECDDNASLLITDSSNDTSLEVINTFKNLDSGNLEIQVLVEKEK